jgi:hypothetical protein
VNLLENCLQIEAVSPLWIVALELGHTADPPDVISNPIVLYVLPVQLAPADFLTSLNRLQHRAAGMSSSTDVINLSRTRRFEEFPKRIDEVVAVDVVTHLLALVPKDAVGQAVGGAFHQISQKPMQFRAGVSGSCQASTAEADRFHSKIPAVLLHQQVGRRFARPE